MENLIHPAALILQADNKHWASGTLLSDLVITCLQLGIFWDMLNRYVGS